MDDYLALTDEQLLAQCVMDRFRAPGPGGQHRNKVDSGVRLRHEPTGLVGQATEARSQHENRDSALRRLRKAIALEYRRAVDVARFEAPPELVRILPAQGGQRIKGRHPEFWRGVQVLLDVFVATDCALGETAALVGVSTGQLSRLVSSEPELFRVFNALREERGMRPLRSS